MKASTEDWSSSLSLLVLLNCWWIHFCSNLRRFNRADFQSWSILSGFGACVESCPYMSSCNDPVMSVRVISFFQVSKSGCWEEELVAISISGGGLRVSASAGGRVFFFECDEIFFLECNDFECDEDCFVLSFWAFCSFSNLFCSLIFLMFFSSSSGASYESVEISKDSYRRTNSCTRVAILIVNASETALSVWFDCEARCWFLWVPCGFRYKFCFLY